MALNTASIEALVTELQGERLPAPAVRRSIREGAGPSIRRSAEALGVSPLTFWRWETGAATPRPAHAALYQAYLTRMAGTHSDDADLGAAGLHTVDARTAAKVAFMSTRPTWDRGQDRRQASDADPRRPDLPSGTPCSSKRWASNYAPGPETTEDGHRRPSHRTSSSSTTTADGRGGAT